MLLGGGSLLPLGLPVIEGQTNGKREKAAWGVEAALRLTLSRYATSVASETTLASQACTVAATASRSALRP
jgi:hypothetical protein